MASSNWGEAYMGAGGCTFRFFHKHTNANQAEQCRDEYSLNQELNAWLFFSLIGHSHYHDNCSLQEDLVQLLKTTKMDEISLFQLDFIIDTVKMKWKKTQ